MRIELNWILSLGFRLVVVWLLLIVACSESCSGQTFTETSGISTRLLRQHIEYLASDSLEGRGTGTRGAEKAAHYIANELRSYKLKPIQGDETFLQRIPMRGSVSLKESKLQIALSEGESLLELVSDYLLYKTGAQTFVPNPTSLVFVGYGISAPEYDYNDYQSMNVEGKIVVFLSGEPQSTDPNYFGGETRTIHSYPEAKQRVAIARGARGSVMIPNPREEGERSWDFWIREFSFEHVTLAYSAAGNLSVLMNPVSAVQLFENARHSLSDIYKMDRKGRIRSFPLKTKISFQGEFRQREFISSNVVALLEGSDVEEKDSYLIISSHYDHLGRGPSVDGDSIYNGAFDNASGVAATLEIARVWSERGPPKRSIIFLFTTGEEKGLLGARYYVDNPVVPLHKTFANLNIDGLALFDTFNDVVGVGSELSTLGEQFEAFVRNRGLKLSSIPAAFARVEAFTRSDQLAFAEAGIPALLIMEGLNWCNTSPEKALQRFLEWGRRTHHSPFDDLTQPLNLKAALQHSNLILDFCEWLANSSLQPEWYPGSPYIHARLQSIAEKR
jgi:hypothetical protein